MKHSEIAAIAKVCHEANKALCEAFGDYSQRDWENAPDWQVESVIEGVKLHIENPDLGPEASHDAWAAYKRADAWVYGVNKDSRYKTHPCLVPFDDLPMDQQAKDMIVHAIVHAMKP